jgi:hypothetical protein
MRRHERAAVLTLVAGLTPILGPSIRARWEGLPPTSVFTFGLAIVALAGRALHVRTSVNVR